VIALMIRHCYRQASKVVEELRLGARAEMISGVLSPEKIQCIRRISGCKLSSMRTCRRGTVSGRQRTWRSHSTGLFPDRFLSGLPNWWPAELHSA
jgi:hypothetical protein